MKFFKALLFVIFILTVTTSQSFAMENSNCNCTLTENIEQFYEEYSFNASHVIKLKDLTPAEVLKIRNRLCMNISFATHSGFEASDFKKIILEGLGEKEDASNANELVSAFLNKYKQELVCPKDKTRKNSRDLHIYKSAVLGGVIDLFDEILLNEEYEIDFNSFEMVDGKMEEWHQLKNIPLTPDSIIGKGEKETLVDFIEKLMDSGQYDYEGMELLRDDVIDAGGKRGNELE